MIHFELDVLARIGLTIMVAFVGGRLLRKIGIPQVVGYILSGMFLGPSFLHLIPGELNTSLNFITEIALGMIGFGIGGHLRFDELKQLGRSIFFIVIFEALGAFVLVGLGVFVFTKSLPLSLILGALAAATAPAATVEVLAEYKAKGPLTTTLRMVLGIDDAIALLLFCVAAAIAESMVAGNGAIVLLEVAGLPLYEIGGSLLLGVVFGLGLGWLMQRFHTSPEEHDSVILPMGIVFLCAGLAQATGLSLILTTMTLGIVVTNRHPDNGAFIRSTIDRIGPVIYILFFALAGARLHVAEVLGMGVLGIIYIVLRSTGKFSGAWLGGLLGQAKPAVRDNLGLALLTQGGVAIGLSLATASRFSELGAEGQAIGSLVLTLITATTMVVEIIGPIGVKVAIKRAGEIQTVPVQRSEEPVRSKRRRDFGFRSRPSVSRAAENIK